MKIKYVPNVYTIDGDACIITLHNLYGQVSGCAIIDIEDVDDCKKVKWCVTPFGYVKGGGTLLHHFIMRSTPSKSCIIDHVNRNRLDNRKENLRFCTKSENASNTKKSKNNTSGFRGVIWNPLNKNWNAQIMKDRKNIYLGTFADKREAALAYNKAAIELHGKFATLNSVILRKHR